MISVTSLSIFEETARIIPENVAFSAFVIKNL